MEGGEGAEGGEPSLKKEKKTFFGTFFLFLSPFLFLFCFSLHFLLYKCKNAKAIATHKF